MYAMENNKSESKFIPLEGIARKAEIAIYANLASMIFFVPAIMWVTSSEGKTVSPEDTEIVLQGIASLIGLLVFLGSGIPAAVFFCKWMYRAYMDALLFNTGAPPTDQDQKSARVNVVGTWFIPIMNLFKPYQNMAFIWHASDAKAERGIASLKSTVPGEIRLWWACWVGSLILDRIGGSKSYGVPIEEMALVAYGVLRIASGFLCIRIMKSITERMEHRSHMSANQP
jgi:hypothetical protein